MTGTIGRRCAAVAQTLAHPRNEARVEGGGRGYGAWYWVSRLAAEPCSDEATQVRWAQGSGDAGPMTPC